MAKKFLSDIKVSDDSPSLNSFKSYDAAYPFSRPSGYPLDRTGFFDTTVNANNYISTKEAYIGQELTIFDSTTTTKAYKYFISNTNKITKLLDSRDIDTETFVFNNTAKTMSIVNDEAAGTETLTEVGNRSIKIGSAKLVFDDSLQGIKIVFETVG